MSAVTVTRADLTTTYTIVVGTGDNRLELLARGYTARSAVTESRQVA
jgi:hypothetical protein